MKKYLLIVTTIFSVTVLIGFYLYLDNSRYYMTVTGSRVYKLDRKTGKMWLVVGNKEVPISPPVVQNKEKNLEELRQKLEIDVIQFVKYQETLSYLYTNEEYIKNYLRKKKGHLSVKGWEAKANFEEKTVFVSFLWEDDSGRRGYFFEFDIELQIVRLINDDLALEKKYGVDMLAFDTGTSKTGK